jgi:hypothetical protein
MLAINVQNIGGIKILWIVLKVASYAFLRMPVHVLHAFTSIFIKIIKNTVAVADHYKEQRAMPINVGERGVTMEEYKVKRLYY